MYLSSTGGPSKGRRRAASTACVIAGALLLQACGASGPPLIDDGKSFPAIHPASATAPDGTIPQAPLIVEMDTFRVAPAGVKPIALPPKLAQLDALLDMADLQAEPTAFIGTPDDAAMTRQALAIEQTATRRKAFIAATNLYRRAAIDGYAPAQFRLGVLTAAGKGVVRNDYTAARWYLLAAEQYHRKALIKLGLAYAQGKGVEHNPTLARLWIGRAADLDDPAGIYALSQLVRFGIGGPIDYAEANRYCRIAAHAGLDLAKTDSCAD